MKIEDKLMVKNMRFWGTHGYFSEENKLGQEFIVDIEIFADMTDMCLKDDLDWDTSYVKLFKAAKKVTTEEEYKLIQRAAYRILEELFANTKATSAKVTLKKPSAPIGGIFDYTACTIERKREEMI